MIHDEDNAVRQFIKDTIAAIAIPKPDGSGTYSISSEDIRLTWPRKTKEERAPKIFIQPGLISDSEYIDGDGVPVENTAHVYEADKWLLDYGPVSVQFSVVGYAQSDDARDLMLKAIRNGLKNVQTDEYELYYDQAISCLTTSSRRIESKETALAGLFPFEINGVGETRRVELGPINTSRIRFDLNVE